MGVIFNKIIPHWLSKLLSIQRGILDLNLLWCIVNDQSQLAIFHLLFVNLVIVNIEKLQKMVPHFSIPHGVTAFVQKPPKMGDQCPRSVY